jgi:hypothetical protein
MDVVIEIGEAIGGMDYTVVSVAIKLFKDRAKQDPNVQAVMDSVGTKGEKWIPSKNPLFSRVRKRRLSWRALNRLALSPPVG